MKHARIDYSRIQDPAAVPGLLDAVKLLVRFASLNGSEQAEPAELAAAASKVREFFGPFRRLALAGMVPEHPIEADEPVFLLRGRDAFAAIAVANYAFIARQRGADAAFVSVCGEWAGEMERWQQDNPERVKIPDVPAPAGNPVS